MKFLKNAPNSSNSLILLFSGFFLTPGILYTHELTFLKVSLKNMKMAMRHAWKSILAHFFKIHNVIYVTLSDTV